MTRKPALSVLVFAVACGGAKAPPPGHTSESAVARSHEHEGERHLANIRQLTRDQGENAEAYWSPDGTELVFQSSRAPHQCDQIYRMPADGSGEATLVSTGRGRTTCAYFSSDQQRIVYSSTHLAGDSCPPPPDRSQGYVWPLYDSYDIFSVKPDGTDLVNLTNNPGYDAEATVCPVDGSILFTSTRDGDLDLYRMDADGKNVRRLTQALGYDGGAFFSQDCSKIVWRASRPTGKALADYQRLLGMGLVRPSQLEIFVANADGSDARQVTYLGAASFAPYLHPSGDRILFSTNHPAPRGREFDIWSIRTDGTGLERITYAPGFDGFPMFSPDGTKLAFGSNRSQARDGQTDVYVADWIEAAHGSVQVTAADRVAEDVHWLADDRREGRGIGTAGHDAAVDWLAERFAEIGLEPAGDGGSFRQTMVVPVSISPAETTTFSVSRRPVAVADYRVASVAASGSARGRLAFVGYGIVAPELDMDDLAGVDLRGKIAVIQRFVPADDPRFAGEVARRRYSDPHRKAFYAREKGAVGVVFVDREGAQDGQEIPLPELRLSKQSNVGIPVVYAKWGVVDRALQRRRIAELSIGLEVTSAPVANVVAKLEGAGAGPGAVVIGAHFDHLGYGGEDSRDPGVHDVHNGADDNASGTAALLEAARLLRSGKRPELDVYFIAFTAEESGLLGSRHFVKNLPEGLAKKDIRAMFNMDMVGRLRDNQVSVIGGDTADEWRDLVMPACEGLDLVCLIAGPAQKGAKLEDFDKLSYLRGGYGASDHSSFFGEGIPVLHFFTGAHMDYHKTTDDADRVHSVGVAKIAELVGALARRVAHEDVRLSFNRVPSPPPEGDLRSFGASLGTIPDYAPGTEPGMVLSGVRPGGPAELAGMRKGDRLIHLGSNEIRSVRDLAHVLRSAKPDQRVTAIVLRDGERLELKVTFGKATRRTR